MKKYIISIIVLFYSLEGMACTSPTEFSILKEGLKTAVEQYESKVGDSIGVNSAYFAVVKWNKKLEMIRTVAEKKFSPSFLEIFNEYETLVETLDRLAVFAQDDLEVLSENDRDKIKELFAYHFYVLTDVLPVVLSPREFLLFPIVKAPSEDLVAKGVALREKLKAELSPQNLLLCKDQEGRSESGVDSPDNLIADTRSSRVDNSEDSSSDEGETLPNSLAPAMDQDFKIDYELTTVEESFKTLPRVDFQKGNKVLKWVKNAFNFLNPFYSPEEEEENSVSISSETYSSNINFISVKQKNLKIKERYLQWENDRNFWIERTKDVSGYKADVFNQKFNKWVVLIEKINEILDESLKNTATICSIQDIPVKCWNGSNSVPQ